MIIMDQICQVSRQHVRIQDCIKCNIYFLDSLDSISVDKCTDCEIYIGPTSGSVFIRDCERCKFTVACQQFRTRNLTHSQVRLFCGTQPIIEDTHHIQMQCFNIGYPSLLVQFREANLNPMNNNWNRIHNFTPDTGEVQFIPPPVGQKEQFVCQQFLAHMTPDVLVALGLGSMGSNQYGNENQLQKYQMVVPLTWDRLTPTQQLIDESMSINNEDIQQTELGEDIENRIRETRAQIQKQNQFNLSSAQEIVCIASFPKFLKPINSFGSSSIPIYSPKSPAQQQLQYFSAFVTLLQNTLNCLIIRSHVIQEVNIGVETKAHLKAHKCPSVCISPSKDDCVGAFLLRVKDAYSPEFRNQLINSAPKELQV
ncbi:MAG: putative protein XRP2 [Streblomastix strix]|uniref:C-CAP/cofactor C-like domain-containing protein n=1 Tax=Streblomastix strix TaxID=222440 RepID=A0A5J4WKS6_9EUKA|nr:MAG: putative protein XRP2 [Streblomastix strix]